MQNDVINVGLASFGKSGKVFHAPFIDQNPHFNLKYILERTKDSSKLTYPSAKIVRDFETILNDKAIDLVVVNTPTYLHYEMTKTALLAGKHVVVEKPFTSTVEEGSELIEIANQNNLFLTVYHNKRLEGDFLTVQKLLQSGKLGEIKEFKNIIHRNKPEIGPKKWKEDTFPGAGLLYDFGSHLIDQCLVLFGWPKDLNAELKIERPGGKVVDYFKLTLIYNDFQAIISVDMMQDKTEPTYQIIGTEGTFEKYGHDIQESEIENASTPIDVLKIGVDLKENHGILSGIKIPTERGAYIDFYENVYQALKNSAQKLVTPDEALQVIEVIEWAEKIGFSNQIKTKY
jgi:predicted dehydrogenase